MAASEGPTMGFLVWRLSLRWRGAVDRALAPLGLTHAQYSLLASLYGLSRAGARPSQRELSDFSGLEPMYVSKLARSLERAGVLERAGNPADPRAVQLTLTPRGVDLGARAVARVLELQEEVTRPLGGPRSPRSRQLARDLLTLLGEGPQHPQDAQDTGEKDEMDDQKLPVSGQVIGEAQKAIEPLLGQILNEVGTTFPAWVTLNTLAIRGSAIEREVLVRSVAGGLNADLPFVREQVVDRLAADGLVHERPGALVELTPAGKELHGRIQARIAANGRRLYADLDPDELATTRRVLVEVTRRARAMQTASGP
jgi:DNA-binding MarR family transcriptional regulator